MCEVKVERNVVYSDVCEVQVEVNVIVYTDVCVR